MNDELFEQLKTSVQQADKIIKEKSKASRVFDYAEPQLTSSPP